MENQVVKCAVCRKQPHEISEYVNAAKEAGMTPKQYVITEEGTYNPKNNKFYCTSCYIKIGMPLGKAK